MSLWSSWARTTLRSGQLCRRWMLSGGELRVSFMFPVRTCGIVILQSISFDS